MISKETVLNVIRSETEIEREFPSHLWKIIKPHLKDREKTHKIFKHLTRSIKEDIEHRFLEAIEMNGNTYEPTDNSEEHP